MRRLALLTALFLFTGFAFFAQVKVVRPVKKSKPKTTNFGIGGGITSSVLFLAQNVKENNNALGFNGAIVYGGSKRNLRASFEYTTYRKVDIEPTWYNIKASTIEANLHIIARFREIKAYFYPIVGLSYNRFSGYFTGINDFLNLRAVYKTNTVATKYWLGVNVGTGYEVYFKKVSFYVDYKMRIGTAQQHKQLNIMDVCFFGGLRYNIKVPSVYQVFRGTRSRYMLDKEDGD